jgi:MFS family permease
LNGRRSGFAAGLKALSQGRLILLLTLATVLLGVSAAVPLWPALDSALSETLAGDHILRNHPTFAPTDVYDFLREKAAAVAAMRWSALWSALLGVLLQVFLAGGIVTVVGRPTNFDWSAFFSAARRNFWHNLKCLLIFALLVLLVVGLWLAGAFALIKKIFEEKPPGADMPVRFAAVAAALLLFGVLSLLYDFARAARRQAPSIGAWRAWGAARRALSGAWTRAIGLFLFWLVAGSAAVLALFALEWGGTAATAAAIAVHTVLQIAVLFARSAVRLGAWGSYLALVDERVPVGSF